jgi:hypothetical protein
VEGVGTVRLALDASPSEREILLAGGLLAAVRHGRRRPVAATPPRTGRS